MADTAYETSYGDRRRDKKSKAHEGSKREEAADRREAKRRPTIAGGMAMTKADLERVARGG